MCYFLIHSLQSWSLTFSVYSSPAGPEPNARDRLKKTTTPNFWVIRSSQGLPPKNGVWTRRDQDSRCMLQMLPFARDHLKWKCFPGLVFLSTCCSERHVYRRLRESLSQLPKSLFCRILVASVKSACSGLWNFRGRSNLHLPEVSIDQWKTKLFEKSLSVSTLILQPQPAFTWCWLYPRRSPELCVRGYLTCGPWTCGIGATCESGQWQMQSLGPWPRLSESHFDMIRRRVCTAEFEKHRFTPQNHASAISSIKKVCIIVKCT